MDADRAMQIAEMKRWEREVEEIRLRIEKIEKNIDSSLAKYQTQDTIIKGIMECHNIVTGQATNLMKALSKTIEVCVGVRKTIEKGLTELGEMLVDSKRQMHNN